MKKLIASIMASAMLLGVGWPMPGAAAAASEGTGAHAPTYASNVSSKMEEAEAPTAGRDYVPGKVLVKLKDDAATKGVGLQSEAGHSIQSMKASGQTSIQTIELLPTTDVLETVRQLNQQPGVEYAEPVYIYRLSEAVDDDAPVEDRSPPPVAPPPPGPIPGGGAGGGGAPVPVREEASVIEVTYGWGYISDAQLQSVTVAIIDSGIDHDHSYLAEYIIPGYNALQPGAAPEDDHGHGTHVAGIIGAKVNPDNGVRGVASGVRIMPIKAFNREGDGTSEDIVRAIDYAVKNGAQVINMSFASGNYSRAIHDAVNIALNKGIAVVAAAGNESNRYIGQEPGNISSGATRTIRPVSYPAALPGVIAVGAAHRLNGQWIAADFSNSGRELAVAAPGVNIVSTHLNNLYASLSGTSQATPFVSGLAALLKGAKPELGLDHIRALIQDGAMDAGAAHMDNDFGAGIVHVGNTLRALYDPRLMVSRSEASPAGKLSLDITVQASDESVSASVYGTLRIIGQTYDRRQAAWTTITGFENRVLEMSEGSATLTFDVPELYDYRFYLDEAGDTSFVRSNILSLTGRPAAPNFSLDTGTYQGNQQVSLSSTTEGAAIYYLSLGQIPVNEPSRSEYLLYSSPINLTQGYSLVLAFASKDGFVSELSYEEYTITAPPPAPIFGGGGGFIPPTPADKKETRKSNDGRVSIEVEVSKERALKELESPSSDKLLIDARSVEASLHAVQVAMPMDVVDSAKRANKPIRVESNELTIEFPAGSIPIEGNDTNADIRLNFAKAPRSSVPLPEGGLRLLGDAWNLEMTKNNKQMTQFEEALSILVQVPSTISYDADRVSAYYYNEQNQAWEKLGGRVNGRMVTFSTEHFSMYAVMEQPKQKSAFHDLEGHWGAADIEWMAERKIINGVDAGVFAPDRQVTRAEFSAMLGRALGLTEKGEARPFSDVAIDSWYHDAVYQAFQAGIVEGTDKASFAPDKTITREQMAVMVMRALEYASGEKLQSSSISPVSAFKDTADMAEWARPYIQAASSAGLLNGKSDGSFHPTSATTRAEAVVVLKRLMNASGKP
jgi:subtilisin family serine protease